jgi:hypothetical protein
MNQWLNNQFGDSNPQLGQNTDLFQQHQNRLTLHSTQIIDSINKRNRKNPGIWFLFTKKYLKNKRMGFEPKLP